MKNLTKKIKQQGAIGTTDLILALAIIGIIVYGIFQVSQGMRSGITKDQVNTQLKAGFPGAVADCIKLRGDLSGCNQARIIATELIRDNTTVCGSGASHEWSVVAAANSVTLTYPLTDCAADINSFGADLAAGLNNLSRITATYADPNMTVVYNR